MDDLLAELAALYSSLGSAPTGVRVIGGLAVRLHVGEQARMTRDIDLVAMTPDARATLLSALESRGYVIGTTGHWWRAAPADGSRRFVDVADHPVVDVRTFDSVSLRGQPLSLKLANSRIEVAAVRDLVLLKLMACRDQDLVDLLLLAEHCAPSSAEIAESAVLDHVERRIAQGTLRARNELSAGALAEAAQQVLGRPVSHNALEALDSFLRALHEEGL